MMKRKPPKQTFTEPVKCKNANCQRMLTPYEYLMSEYCPPCEREKKRLIREALINAIIKNTSQ